MRLLLCSFSLFLFAALANAQRFSGAVYGDDSTKKYYSAECSEVAKIKQTNLNGFKNPEAAEKAGFAKGESCTTSLPVPERAKSKDQFFGDRSRKLYYPESCSGKVSIPLNDLVTFSKSEDPESLGYKIALCLPVHPAPQQSEQKIKVVPMKRERLPLVIAITSEPSEWLGKLVTVMADVKITDLWRYDEDTYAFVISDGSASFYLYMEKKAARGLRDLILRQPAGEGVYGRFTFYLNPAGYLIRGDLYGRLVSYNVRAD